MIELTDEKARKRAQLFGKELLVANIGAQEKLDGSLRTLHDGTHKVGINNRIVQRDQCRYPSAAEIKRVQSEARRFGRSIIMLAGDARKAHQVLKILEEEWTLLACRLLPGRLWPNKVGNF